VELGSGSIREAPARGEMDRPDGVRLGMRTRFRRTVSANLGTNHAVLKPQDEPSRFDAVLEPLPYTTSFTLDSERAGFAVVPLDSLHGIRSRVSAMADALMHGRGGCSLRGVRWSAGRRRSTALLRLCATPARGICTEPRTLCGSSLQRC